MASPDSITLKAYYASFKKLAGIAASLTGIVPLALLLIPVNNAAYLFPPLGDKEILARGFVSLLAFFATYVVFFISKDAELPGIRRLISYSMLFALASLLLYIAFDMRFVRKVPIPARNVSIHVSVGFERTDFAKSVFGNEASDLDLLRGRGFDEEQITKLWTWRSLLAARLTLLLAYCGFLLALVAGFSLGVVHDLKARLT